VEVLGTKIGLKMAIVESFQFIIFKTTFYLERRSNPITVDTRRALLSFGVFQFVMGPRGSGKIATKYF
jgi:hypothetical protein